MPNLVKIGYTAKSAEERADELYSTGVPTPFKVVHKESCDKPKALEALVHKELDEKRKNKNREFFEFGDPSEAAQKIEEIHKDNPEHAACFGNQPTDSLVDSKDDGVWRKWTSHFLTRFKRKVNTE